MTCNYEGVHFSKAAVKLLKINSFADIFQPFSNIYTNIYFTELLTLASPVSISFRRIKHPYWATVLVSIIDICFFLIITVFSLKKFSIKEGGKVNTGFLVLKDICFMLKNNLKYLNPHKKRL